MPHNVLDLEIEGLQALRHVVASPNFARAVEIILGLSGKLVVSGMGKSGHVARKIAATLASTGSPAFFVHPGEASHGDLGMITSADGLMLLSNSGETAELKDMIEYSRRNRIPLIGIARRKTSALVDAADVAIILPEVPEALPASAPSTSTTMMMALGDVIAASLMEKRGFTENDFGNFHPGGKLGKKFIKVSDIMRKGSELPLVAPELTMRDVLPLMTEKSLGCAIVVDSSNIMLGIITDGDLRRHISDSMMSKPAKDVMKQNPLTIRPNALASEALAIMNERKITSLTVVEERKITGLIHIHDALRV